MEGDSERVIERRGRMVGALGLDALNSEVNERSGSFLASPARPRACWHDESRETGLWLFQID